MNPLDDPAGLDETVGRWVVGNRVDWLDPVVLAVTQLGSSVLLVPLVVAVGLSLGVRRRAWAPLALLAAAHLGATAAYTAGKALTGRLRPQLDPLVLEDSLSFPSGHATQAAAVWLALAAVAVAWMPPSADTRRRRRLVWAGAASVAVAVAASRVYLGVHWLTDVLAGLLLGAGWTLLLVRLVGRDLAPLPPPRTGQAPSERTGRADGGADEGTGPVDRGPDGPVGGRPADEPPGDQGLGDPAPGALGPRGTGGCGHAPAATPRG